MSSLSKQTSGIQEACSAGEEHKKPKAASPCFVLIPGTLSKPVPDDPRGLDAL